MFKGINALLKTLDKFHAIDSQCQSISEEMEVILPELADNAIAVSFARDSIKELNEKLKTVRAGAESLTERVPSVVEESLEPEHDIEEAINSDTPEDDDEADIIIEDATGEIFPAEDDSPIPDFEEERREVSPLDRVEDWDRLYQARVEDLISADAQKEARALKKQCLEIRKTMYDENGDIVHMTTEDSGMTKGAQSVWDAAMKELVRLKADEFIATRTPEQKAAIDEMLDDLDIADSPSESSVSKVDEISPDLDEELDALLESIE